MSGVLGLAPIIEVFRGLFFRLLDMTDGRAHSLLVAKFAGRLEEDTSAVGAYIPAYFKRFLTIHRPACYASVVSLRGHSRKPIVSLF